MKNLSDNYLFLFLCLIMLLLQSACGESNQETAAKANPGKADADTADSPAIPVKVVPVIRDEISAAILTTATVEADRSAEIYAKTTAVVEQVLVEEGDLVRKGQVLVTLDNDEVTAGLAKAEAALAARKQEFNRAKAMRQDGLISQEEYESKQQEYLMAQADWQTAKVSFDQTVITAPFKGTITARHINIGKMARPNEPLFTLVDLKTLVIYAFLPELEWYRVRPEQPVVIETDALPRAQFQGSVWRISPIVDPGNGTFKVTIGIDDPSSQLKPGMFVRVKILTDIRKNTLIVPKIALLNGTEAFTVVTVEDTTAARDPADTPAEDTLAIKVRLKIGLSDAERAEIRDGLKEGDWIIVAGHRGLKDSTRVVIIDNEQKE